MGRRKIEIKAIKDDRNRSVTFLKRKGGLFKKAHELSVLCSVDVAVIIFGHNKKLYEFSSGDINETIGRYQYYGGAHEHKGPEDFRDKGDGDDDEDVEDDVAPPQVGSHSPPEQHMMAHHLQHQPAFQHMRHPTPSASPPVPNGFPHRQSSPMPPHGISRPNSAMHVRRTSSNLNPQQHHAATHPAPGNYAYMPNPPIYNPQAAAGMPMRGTPGPPQHPQPQQAPHPPQYPYNQPAPHPHMQHMMQQEQRRQSMPPGYPHERPGSVPAPSPQPQHQQLPQQGPQYQQQQQQQPQQQPPPQQQHQQPPPPQQQQQQQHFQSPPLPQPKPLPASKSHSIFTPIDDSRSMLAQHWNSTSVAEPPRSEPVFKTEGPRSHSIDTASISRAQINGRSPQPPHAAQLPPQQSRTNSVASVPSIAPPSRTNSMQTDAKRPRLKVQIPSEHSDGGEGTADSSSKDTTAGAPQPGPGRGEQGNASGVVLPPPSPSASALLSAGASGPPNPFARPPPPVNNGAFGNRGDMDTPMSALPSRFVADQLLPSPSSFYPEWGFGRDSNNMLPSPLTFQTPVVMNGPSFRDQDDADRKRKTSDGSENGLSKRLKS